MTEIQIDKRDFVTIGREYHQQLLDVTNAAEEFINHYKHLIQSDEYKGIWTFLHVHNNEYRGPIFKDPQYLIDALTACDQAGQGSSSDG